MRRTRRSRRQVQNSSAWRPSVQRNALSADLRRSEAVAQVRVRSGGSQGQPFAAPVTPRFRFVAGWRRRQAEQIGAPNNLKGISGDLRVPGGAGVPAVVEEIRAAPVGARQLGECRVVPDERHAQLRG
jgi:hypothetical protein